MGSHASSKQGKMSLNDLPKILGEAMPDLPKNSIGRFRLVRALQQRFGKNFRSLPGVTGLIEEFDGDIKFDETVQKMSRIKTRKK